jgi:hypothetical protein
MRLRGEITEDASLKTLTSFHDTTFMIFRKKKDT